MLLKLSQHQIICYLPLKNDSNLLPCLNAVSTSADFPELNTHLLRQQPQELIVPLAGEFRGVGIRNSNFNMKTITISHSCWLADCCLALEHPCEDILPPSLRALFRQNGNSIKRKVEKPVCPSRTPHSESYRHFFASTPHQKEKQGTESVSCCCLLISWQKQH